MPLFTYQQTALLLSIWVLNVFGNRISGGHYNPAVSLANMIRRDNGKIPRLLGLIYILAQLLGAFVGALVSWFLMGNFFGLRAAHLISDTKLD